MKRSKEKNLQKRAILRVVILGALTVAFIILSVIALTQNSLGAKNRYDALIAVDKSGGDVETSLNTLRTYIYSHMNTKIGSDLGVRPPIQLKGSYDRLVAQEKERVDRANQSLYSTAQAYCEKTQSRGFSGRNRIDCIQNYIDKNGQVVQPVEEVFYKFDFAPPVWSPDLAGYSILASGIFGLLFIVDVFLYYRTRRMVRLAN